MHGLYEGRAATEGSHLTFSFKIRCVTRQITVGKPVSLSIGQRVRANCRGSEYYGLVLDKNLRCPVYVRARLLEFPT